MQERFQRRFRALRLVMLKHRVQPDHREIFLGEHAARPRRLRQTFADTAGAEHLEGDREHDAPAQAFEHQRLRRVEPGFDLQFRRFVAHRPSPIRA